MDLMANNNLGRELVHLRADIRKIIFHVGIRILFTALIIFTILIEYFCRSLLVIMWLKYFLEIFVCIILG